VRRGETSSAQHLGGTMAHMGIPHSSKHTKNTHI